MLLLVRAGQNGSGDSGCLSGPRPVLPFIDRVQEAVRRYAESARARRWTTVVGRAHARLRGRLLRLPSWASRCFPTSASRWTAGEIIGVVGPSGAGKSTLIQLLLQLRTPGGRSLSRERGARDAVRARGLAQAGRPMCRRNRVCCMHRLRTTSASFAPSTTRPSNGRPGLLASTTTS